MPTPAGEKDALPAGRVDVIGVGDLVEFVTLGEHLGARLQYVGDTEGRRATGDPKLSATRLMDGLGVLNEDVVGPAEQCGQRGQQALVVRREKVRGRIGQPDYRIVLQRLGQASVDRHAREMEQVGRRAHAAQ